MSAGRMVRLLSMLGVVRVMVCPLCAALVVLDGEAQHRASHSADVRRTDDGRPSGA